MRPSGSAIDLERRRRRALRLLRTGLSVNEVALRVGADPSSVRRWRQAFRRRGARGLDHRPQTGRPSLLTTRQKNGLMKRLRTGARANGFSTDVWTCPRIAELIERRYGVCFHVDHIPRLLQSLTLAGSRLLARR